MRKVNQDGLARGRGWTFAHDIKPPYAMMPLCRKGSDGVRCCRGTRNVDEQLGVEGDKGS